MKRFQSLALAILIVVFVLCGCSGEDALVGVYMPKESSAEEDTIILYKDGTCRYFGNSNAVWAADGDVVTVTTYRPAEYYLDAYLNDTVSHAEMNFVGTVINTMESVVSTWVFEDAGSIRVKIDRMENVAQAQADIESLSEVDRVVADITEVVEIDHTLKVVDGCLVTAGGEIYIKQGK